MHFETAIELAPRPPETAHYPLVVGALSTLLRASPEELDDAIDDVLSRLGDASGADRAYLFVRQDGRWFNTHEWCADGIDPVKDHLQGVALDEHEAMATVLAQGKGLFIRDVTALPGSALRSFLLSQQIHSIQCVPVLRDGVFYGFLGFDRVGEGDLFTGAEAGMLWALTDGLLSAVGRQRVERALSKMRTRQTETLERLRATLAAMPELMLEFDEDGRCIDYHCSAPELLAGEPEAILNRTLEETLPPSVARLQRAAMAEALDAGVSHPPDYEIDGHWYRLTVARVAPDSGGRTRYVFRIRDVTDERAREAENDLLIQVTRRMTNRALVLNRDCRIHWANPAFEQRTGLTLDDIRGMPLDEAFAIQGVARATIDRIMAAIDAHETVQIELELRNQAGERYWGDIAMQPLPGRDGAFQGYLIIGTDITERKRHEAELKRMADETAAAHARLHGAIESMQDGFVLFDRDNKLLMCNSKYREINAEIDDIIRPGVTLPEIIRTATERGVYLADGSQAREQADRLIHAIDDRDFSGELHYRNGRVIGVRATRMPDGNHVGLRTDITAIRRAEQRLNDIIRGARVGTWELDLTTGTEVVNSYLNELLGLGDGQVDEITTQRWLRLARETRESW
ncbi:MAG: PAS domain S-box [Rhodobacteraceae bacterium HLUCCA12]|nr:MAG: PAS domain S-box [Rhodobacteraceae bacterium HLUCCA12]